MKKVLILAYDFPPYVSVGGLRPYAWLKYLPEYGVEPIVVTRYWGNDYGNGLDYIAASPSNDVEVNQLGKGLVIRTPYVPNFSNRLLLKYGANRFKLLRKCLTAWAEITQFFWVTGTKKELYYAADEYLEDNKVDIIIATGDPFILFDFARKLSSKHDVPWIADYRDPWSTKRSEHFLWDSYSRFWEKRIVKEAKYITTVSMPISNLISTIVDGSTIELLPNGFDPEIRNSLVSIQQSRDVLTISLAGSLYGWHPWKHFLKVVNEAVVLDGLLFKLRFYGLNIQSEVDHYIKTELPNLIPFVEFVSRLDNDLLLTELSKDNVLLLFNDYSIEGTKVFDYVGVNRKIILCFENDLEANILKEHYFSFDESIYGCGQLQQQIVEETQSGIIVKDEQHLREVLTELANEFSASGKISCNSINVDQYSRKVQVERLAGLIHELTDK